MRVYQCKECAAKRKKMRDHIKKAELAKAARVAAEGVAHMAGFGKLKRKPDDSDNDWDAKLLERKRLAEGIMSDHDENSTIDKARGGK